jgi:hypothetical protein
VPDPFLTAGVPAAAGLVCVALSAWMRDRRRLARGVLSLGVLGLAFGLAELGCWAWLVQSDNVNRTLASQRWFERHWEPINGLGFRDAEHVGRVDDVSELIFFVGDSFTAGQGMDDASLRFADLVGAARGPDARAVVVAQCGWNTSNQREAVDGMAAQLGRSPTEVVLSYVPNDILDPRYLVGRSEPFALPSDPTAGGPSWLSWMSGCSYLLDALWWRVVRQSALGELAREHGQTLRRALQDEHIWAAHAADLRALAERVSAHGAALTVVVFPDLLAPDGTRAHTARVAELFRQTGARVHDLGPTLSGRDPEELVTSPRDGHPGPRLHAELAALLLGDADGG